MSPDTASAIVVAVVVVTALLLLTIAVRRRSEGGAAIGKPDAVSEDVMTNLIAEIKRERAEKDYWKTTAERLQRRLDSSAPPD